MTLNPGETNRPCAEGKPQQWHVQGRTSNVPTDRELGQYRRGFQCVHDLQGRFLAASPVLTQVLGYTAEEILQMSLADLIDKNSVDQFEQYLRDIENLGESRGMFAVMTRRDERLYWTYHGTLQTGESETPRVQCLAHDITDSVKKIMPAQPDSALGASTGRETDGINLLVDRDKRTARSEIALRESEERLRLAQQVAQIGMFERNLLTGESRWTPEMEAIYGIPPGKSPRSVDGFLELIHPEDRAQVVQWVEQSRNHGEASGEWRVIWPDGTVRWVSGRWRVFKDSLGNPTRAIGMDFDVTDRKRVEEALREATEKLTEEKFYLEQEINTELGFEDILGQSSTLRAAMENASKVAASDATVLLLGETGTGKELVARAIHKLSRRSGNGFIKMNCAAIPSGLLESELFGNERGAFTGAVSKKIGRLELADKGTMFLDEVGEISLALQPKLLRVLQDHEFERLGATQTLKVDFRLIAATNRDLAEGVRENEFRSDLYYRLNVFPIRLPPLRERRDDIPLLVEHFVQKSARRMNKSIISIPKKTMNALTDWDWPGNVRELENFIERSVILTNGSVLAAPLLELKPRTRGKTSHETLEAAERQHILDALRESRGQISGPRGAAARLGLKRTTLQSRLSRMGINRRLPPAN